VSSLGKKIREKRKPAASGEGKNFYVPLPYILHLTDSCPFSKEP